MLYVVNFLVTFILLLICQIKKLPEKTYLYVTTIYYIFVLGQRWAAGVDFPGYFVYYLIGFKREYGYYYLQQFFYNHNIHFGILIFLIYVFTTVVSLWFFRKFTKSNLSIFLFFLSEYHIMSINPLRTYIALNIFLIGLYYWEFKEKYYLGLAIMLLGTLFHSLTLPIVIAFLIFKLIKILEFQKYINYGLLLLPLINFKSIIKYIVTMLVPQYLEYFGSHFDHPLSMMNILRYYIILVLFIYLQKMLSSKNQKERIILFGMYGFLIFMGISAHMASLHRLALYFKIFEPIFFLYILDYKEISMQIKVLIISVFVGNYFGIIYKDMGVLQHYEFKRLQLFNDMNKEEMFKELERLMIKQGWK